MGKTVTIYTFSDWQIGCLTSYFNQVYEPDDRSITIENLGISTDGDVIISYTKYGRRQTDKIPREPNQKSSWDFKIKP